jgi:hypothetical protein
MSRKDPAREAAQESDTAGLQICASCSADE